MRYFAIPIVVVVAVCAVGCTTAEGTPATAPDTTAAAETTSTAAPEVTTTSTSAPTTTTLDRTAEITAIFEDLERRRLDAIYSGDVEGFEALYVNAEYLDLDRIALEVVTVVDPGALIITDLDVASDGSDCIAFTAHIDTSAALDGGVASETTVVLERLDNEGGWGYSWVGEGWTCDGPHPMSG